MADRIRCDADIDAALYALAAMDPRLAAIRASVPVVPLRLMPAGFAGLLRIVAGQQLSTQSADAVFSRFTATFDPLTAEAILATDDDALRAAGLSRQKAKTFRAVAAAVADGLDLSALAEMDPDTARDSLETISGIGRWTADLYLMFCAGHPDIFPVGDLAVRRAAQRALGLDDEPGFAALAAIAEAWSPHRSTAARLMWAYYRVDRASGAATRTTQTPAGFPL
ncbi:DNA-3-methyladenine glycosylase 2 family protein [Acuticoccus sp. M5D2P5]|uniref:DNA-3-methyladenine glycosylase family protein n=1 Tax=Acuticoccus kalidii TaxID=2910977 RepID=UPI001F42F1AB|nr:DNA-3-methyladenine glycosylase 2 family protein [Acuticoccus kalidii]MCF3932243.1 DNA-3-methyladenine glycosylase 2 family protein [Acuticoccus kalidii]